MRSAGERPSISVADEQPASFHTARLAYEEAPRSGLALPQLLVQLFGVVFLVLQFADERGLRGGERW